MKEITKDIIEKIYDMIDKRYPEESATNIKNYISENRKLKKDDLKDKVDSIIAYEKGMTESTKTNWEITFVYSTLAGLLSGIITSSIKDEVISIIIFMVSGLTIQGVFKIKRTFKRNFLISVLESWSYEEDKNQSEKQITDDLYAEYTVKIKKVNMNQPSI